MTICERGVSLVSPASLASRMKHWGRTGVAFGICNEQAEAEACFAAAVSLSGHASGHEEPLLLEAEILIKGWQAWVLHFNKLDPRLVLQRLEEAHGLVQRTHATVEMSEVLLGARRYLAEHVAFAAATQGFHELADKRNKSPYDQRALIRMVDLAVGLLPDADTDAKDLRGQILRLRAWLCMEEDELDMAAQTLAQHDDQSNDVYRLLQCNLLFRTNQAGEACSRAVEWLRSATPGSLCFEGAMDTIALMIEREEGATALQLCYLVLERLRAGISLLDGGPTTELSAGYSEVAELTFHILSEIAPDSAGCTDHLETCLDGHLSERFPLNETALRLIAAKLWEKGTAFYHESDLHRAASSIETAFRFLEHTDDKGATARAQATLAQCYLLQDRLEPALARAGQAIQLGAQLGLDVMHGTDGEGLAPEISPWTLAQVRADTVREPPVGPC